METTRDDGAWNQPGSINPEKGEPGDGNRRVRKKRERNSVIGFWGNPSPCDDNSYITSHCFEEGYVSLKVFWELLTAIHYQPSDKEQRSDGNTDMASGVV
ncbi:hypothetical protein [Bifidobacterium aquikefiri]|uniref:hypothetical protein n=1 Tax=Bifidobacterium aquikefiri TaxID=1653207 RepID=UPI0039EB2EF1